MSDPEDDTRRARARWKHRGGARPAFALEPGPGQESVWDYPRPPVIVPDERRIRVRADGVTLADTRRSLKVLETASPPTFYLPPADIQTDLLLPIGKNDRLRVEGSRTLLFGSAAHPAHRDRSLELPGAVRRIRGDPGIHRVLPERRGMFDRRRAGPPAARALLRRLGHLRDRGTFQRGARNWRLVAGSISGRTGCLLLRLSVHGDGEAISDQRERGKAIGGKSHTRLRRIFVRLQGTEG